MANPVTVMPPQPAFMLLPQQAPLPSIHANVVTLKVSSSDIGIVFAHEVPQTAPGAPSYNTVVQQDILVNMPLPTAKVLGEFLMGVVKEMETIVGPIKIPAEGRPSADTLKLMVAKIRELKLVD